MISDELNKLWDEMDGRASDSGSYEGLLRQRIPGKWSYEYFVGLSLPARERFFYFAVDSDFLPSQQDFPVTRGFRAERVHFPGASQPCILRRLLDASFKDVFTSLVLDLVDHMNGAAGQAERVKTFMNRLRRWQYFMKGFREEGLSPESQRGLYGELHFFETVLFPRYGAGIVAAWTGPERAHQDFQFSECAVEVKTSIQKQPHIISIANAKELDEVPYEYMFLWHASLDQNRSSGETLNEKVSRVAHLLSEDAAASALYSDKLREYGYLESQTQLYDNIFYAVRNCNFYHVRDEFPRILASDLRKGVGQIGYGISIDVCSDYSIDENIFYAMTAEVDENGCQ